MDLELFLQRETSANGTTFGDLSVGDFAPIGEHECLTLEDQIREPQGWRDGIPGWDADGLQRAVLKWKVPHETAIPAARYELTLQDSQRFGPDTITILGVPGYVSIRMHGGNDKDDTEGCVLVGDQENRTKMTIAGAKFDHVLDKLKAKVKAALAEGKVFLTIRNPTGTPADQA